MHCAITGDDQAKAERVELLLKEAAAGKVRLVTAEMVIAEVVRVLESSYGLKSAPLDGATLEREIGGQAPNKNKALSRMALV